ncbi:MAG: helicase-related protein [Patescibacteria group bacterium]
MSTDQTFLTNEPGKRLVDRFRTLINDTRLFDCLVGYFFASGFHQLYNSLEKTEKIRILIGLKTDRTVKNLFDEGQIPLGDSHAEIRDEGAKQLAKEMAESDDSPDVEAGAKKFIEWIRSDKLEIRACNERLHSKLYIMSFKKGHIDEGRVITGSSNFTSPGLKDNLEFNVELKNRSDFDYALNSFNELWEKSVDLSDRFVDTMSKDTWLNDKITPYELYLKFLYEYFKERLSPEITAEDIYLPERFKKLQYQQEAVASAYKIVREYGGVFLSDVVGLGKTYMAAMLASQLEGGTLVIAPPSLLDENNPGSWPNVFRDFGVRRFRTESLGKLDHLLTQGVERYKNVIIDESHRFRTEDNKTYESLAKICRNKRVVLVSATPLNNTPKDIFSQIKLFQPPRKSDIPGVSNLEEFFGSLDRKIKKIKRGEDFEGYAKTTKENAKEIREKVLRHLMIRRTRKEVAEFFKDDIEKQGLSFPEVKNPKAVYYQLSKEEDRIFTRTLTLIKNLNYARYKPMLYYLKDIGQAEEQAQINLVKFMEVLLVKRLESSFFAFRQTIDRFVATYEGAISEYDNGRVFVSKKYANKIFGLLESGDEDGIQHLLATKDADAYKSSDFKKTFREDLVADLKALQEIQSIWKSIKRDPKLEQLLADLKSEDVLKKSKLIIFTESGETADYLHKEISKHSKEAIKFSGSSSEERRRQVIDNFDANARNKSDEFRLLITTDVLAEGVNLHRSNVVLNYDIPWNPTRMMQRVGRINRVDTPFKVIHSYNFFPTTQANTQIKLQEAAEAKIMAFIDMLGADAKLLTEGEEIKSHDLFSRLNSKATITGEEEDTDSELAFFEVIRNVRDKDSKLFAKIKRLPKKARAGRKAKDSRPGLVTYFRKGRLEKFYLSSKEIDFMEAAKVFEAEPQEKTVPLDKAYYSLLDRNKGAFTAATTEDEEAAKGRGGRDTTTKLRNILTSSEMRGYEGFSDEDETFLNGVVRALEEGSVPAHTRKELHKALEAEIKGGKANQTRILALTRRNFPEEFLASNRDTGNRQAGPREVILSEYFVQKK